MRKKKKASESLTFTFSVPKRGRRDIETSEPMPFSRRDQRDYLKEEVPQEKTLLKERLNREKIETEKLPKNGRQRDRKQIKPSREMPKQRTETQKRQFSEQR
jgi:hypothetical protein